MKKFTVISLLLVLVAGFVFAADITPYVESGYGITYNGVVLEKDFAEEEFDNKRGPFLSSLNINGNFVAGVTAGNVDVSLVADVEYNDVPREESVGYKFYEGELLLKEISPAKWTDKLLSDVLDFSLGLNFAYDSDNLLANASVEFTSEKYDGEIFTMDTPIVSKNRDLILSADATYAQNLKNSDNIVKVYGSETVTFDNMYEFASATAAGLTFYIPVDGATATDALGKKFAGYSFKADLNANIGFDTERAQLVDGTVSKGINGSIEYVRPMGVGELTLGAKAGANNAESKTTINGAASAAFEAEKTIGAGTHDAISFAADAELSTKYVKDAELKPVKFDASVTVGAPRLIPVELYSNMALNLPFEVTAEYEYCKDAGAADGHYFGFEVTAHPITVDFAKVYTVFDQTIDSLDTYVTYGNGAQFAKLGDKAAEGDTYSKFGAGLSLELSKATFAVDYLKYDGADAGLFTMSYTKSY